MAITTQRIVVMFIMINLAIGVIDLTYNGATTWEDIVFNDFVDKGDTYRNTFQDEDVIYGSTSQSSTFAESTIMSTITTGLSIGKLMLMTFIPVSVLPHSEYTDIENALIWVLMIFRMLLATIMGIEMYNLFKNKKAT